MKVIEKYYQLDYESFFIVKFGGYDDLDEAEDHYLYSRRDVCESNRYSMNK
jgi:hypothetical protein